MTSDAISRAEIGPRGGSAGADRRIWECPPGGELVNFSQKQLVFEKSSIIVRQVVPTRNSPCWTRMTKSCHPSPSMPNSATFGRTRSCHPCRTRKVAARLACPTMIELCQNQLVLRKVNTALPGRHPHFWPSAPADPACEPISAARFHRRFDPWRFTGVSDKDCAVAVKLSPTEALV